MSLNKYIDHTILKADALKVDIDKVISEALQYDFASVCINPTWVKYVSTKLKDSYVMTCTVIGFPLGASTTNVKVFETKDAIANGADEIDMVINIAKLIDGEYDYVQEEIRQVVDAACNKTVKVIIETCLLNKEQIKIVSELCLNAKAHFVKTSTGFSTGGATIEDVELIKSVVCDNALIKASGGVRSFDDANEMIKSGANRIGTSGGVNILNGLSNNESY
jgi:deoxyribose-phosphate aldolase